MTSIGDAEMFTITIDSGVDARLEEVTLGPPLLSSRPGESQTKENNHHETLISC
jgi:hypothetical protein